MQWFKKNFFNSSGKWQKYWEMQVLHDTPWVRVAWADPVCPLASLSKSTVVCFWQHCQLMKGTDPSSPLSPVRHIWVTVASAGFSTAKEHPGVGSAKVPWRLLRGWGVSDVRKGWENWACPTWRTENSGFLIPVYVSNRRKGDRSYSGVQDRNKDNRHTLEYRKFHLNNFFFLLCRCSKTGTGRLWGRLWSLHP